MNKIFRMLSLFLVLIVFFGCLQGITFAAEPIQISIPTLSEGIVFEEGTSIPLSVSHNSDITTISHVDFYANDEKLPGAILSGEESKVLMWYSPSVGEYKVYARIHYIGEGFYDSEKISVIIRPNSNGSIPTEPMIAIPEIPNGQQNVGYDLRAYRIRFNRPLAHFLTEDKLTGITMYTRDGEVELDYEIGVDYLDLVPKGHENLETDKTYVVAIPENTLCDAFGNKVKGQAFTFSTVKTVANRSTPIPSVSYPENGDLVKTTGVELAAKVLFPPENAENVKFYDNGKEIVGKVVKGTDGEFILEDVSFSSGEHSISVSVWKNGETISSEAIKLLVITGSYEVLGVQNGDRIILNPQVDGYTAFQHKVAIVDSDQVSTNLLSNAGNDYLTDSVNFTLEPTATGIDSVTFAIDGVIVMTDTTAPYEFVLGSEHKGEHMLTATIKKTNGGVETKTISYTGILGETHDSRSVDYNSGVLDASNTPTFNGVVSRGETIENGVLKLTDNNGISAVWMQPDVQTKELQLGDTKLFYIDYDIKKSIADVQFALRTSRGYRASNISTSSFLQRGFPTNRWVHVTIVADYERGWFSAYLDGVQFKSWSQPYMLDSVSDLVTDSLALRLYGGELYIDNYAVRTYDAAEEASYEIRGISQYETVYANEKDYQMQLVLTDSSGNAITDLKKAVFKLNGEIFATVTEAPFICTLPLTQLGTQILAVEMTDSCDVNQMITVPFAVQFKVSGAVNQGLIADATMPAGKAAVANFGKATSYVLYEAVYTAEGMMKCVTWKTVDIAANEIQIHTAESDLKNGEKVKLFTWTKELQPLY